MRGRRYSEDEIKALLREVTRRRGRGETLAASCEALGISPSSYRRWRKTFGTSADEGRTDAQGGTRALSPKLSEHAKKRLDAANAASGAARNAWLAFLLLLAYFLVTLAGVSHRDLLLNDPVTLPIVNVEIPLFSFFGFAPVLLLLVYLSLLIQHVVLARKYRDYVAAIAPYEAHARREHPSRQLVHSYVVSQLLAGPKTNLVMNRLMRLMVTVAFVVLPIAALLYFQLKFLPYHDIGITYWHRFALLLGLLMVLVLLPMMQLVPRKREVVLGPRGLQWRKTRASIAVGLVFASGVLGFSWDIATIPGEAVDRRLGFLPPKHRRILLLSRQQPEATLLNPVVLQVYDHIPDADHFSQRGWLLDWLLSYRVLVVEDEDMVPNEDDKHGEVSVVLRDRDLRFARLNRSDLHRADLTRADLHGAELTEARLEDAKLAGADLRGANLWFAELQRADFKHAKLHRVDLTLARAQEANFEEADLHGADLALASLQGARLAGAGLYGADLQSADLQGADLSGAHLHGADLESANLQGANLRSAQLHGADLSRAKLHAANLERAGLYGAILSGAALDGAVVRGAKVWLAEGPPALPPAKPVGLNTLDLSPLTDDEKAGLERDLARVAVDANFSSAARLRLALMVCGATPAWKDEAEWRDLRQTADPDPEDIALIWAKTACNDPTGYVAKSLARKSEYIDTRAGGIAHFDVRASQFVSKTDSGRAFAKIVAEKLLDESCIGARSLPDDVKARLKALVASADAASQEDSPGEDATP